MLNIYTLLSAWIISQLFFYFDWPVRPDRILFVVLLGHCFYSYSRGQLNRLSFGKTELCMLVFTFVANLSLFLAGTNVTSGVGKNTQLLQVANLSLYPFITYFVAKHIPYSSQGVRRILKTLVLIGSYLGATAIFERYGLDAFIWPRYIADPSVGIHFGRARGPFLNSVFLGLNLIFCMAAMLITWEAVKSSWRKILVVAIVADMLAIYFTNTRGTWIGLGIVFLTTLFFPVRMRRLITTLMCLAALAFVFGNASQFSLAKGTLFSKRQNTVLDREVNFKVAWIMGSENPIFGIGWGRMGSEWNKYYDEAGAPEFGGWDGNHNEWLGVFAQLGLVGLIPYLMIFALLGRLTLDTYRRLPQQMAFEKCLTICALALLGSFVVMANFSDVHSSPLHNNLLFMFCGLVANVAYQLNRTRWPVDPKAAGEATSEATTTGFAGAQYRGASDAARIG